MLAVQADGGEVTTIEGSNQQSGLDALRAAHDEVPLAVSPQPAGTSVFTSVSCTHVRNGVACFGVGSSGPVFGIGSKPLVARAAT